MTLTCPRCEGYDVELIEDNGAEYPTTRVEHYRCNHCSHLFKEVLTA